MAARVRPGNISVKQIMSLIPGQVLETPKWRYKILEAVKGDGTQQCSIFRAVMQSQQDFRDSKLFVIIFHDNCSFRD